jgi:hypothetical protein
MEDTEQHESLLNAIESINVLAKFDFDKEHPVVSNVNDTPLFLDDTGGTEAVNVTALSGEIF